MIDEDKMTPTQFVAYVGGTGIMLLTMTAQLFSMPELIWGLAFPYVGGALLALMGMYKR